MSDQPQPLADADFVDDAPPGYRSQRDKDRYVPRMAALLGGTFVLQMTLPAVIMMITVSLSVMQSFSRATPEYGKMTAWQDALWYPAGEGPAGGRRACRLAALDLRGNPLDNRSIDLDLQPEWLITDGERLWAVSRNEVAEVLPDDSRPVSMHPARALQHPSRPFLYQGKLAVIDRDVANSRFALFLFDNGEWRLERRLSVPDFSAAALPLPATPADALLPENASPADDEAQRALQQLQLRQMVSMTLGTGEELQAVVVDGVVHVVSAGSNRLYYHRGLPFENSDRSEWIEINVAPAAWTLTTVKGDVALLAQSQQPGASLQLWRLDDGRWTSGALSESLGGGPGSRLAAFTTPDGGRTFAIAEVFGGLSHELLEVKADAVVRIASLPGGFPFANPAESAFAWYVQLPVLILTAIMILGADWLMAKHRDPNYYKGRIPVAYASLLRRSLAVGIDLLVISGPVCVVWWLWFQRRHQSYWQLNMAFGNDPAGFLRDILPELQATAAWIAVSSVIYWLMLAWGGLSIGKWLCGVRVARTNLQPPGLLRALVRMLVASFETMFGVIIPVTLVAFLQNRQRLADLVAGTIVVKAARLRQARAVLADDPYA